MAGFVQQDGKIYVGSAGCVASVLVTTANLLAELNGNVTIDITWEKAEARWRTKAVKDRYAYFVDAEITVEELEFKASTFGELMTHASTGSMPLYGTTTTALFWRLTTSTAPKNVQFCFEFRKTSDMKRMQIYAPKVQVENYPMPFIVPGLTLQDITFQLMASTSGKFIDILQAVTNAY